MANFSIVPSATVRRSSVGRGGDRAGRGGGVALKNASFLRSSEISTFIDGLEGDLEDAYRNFLGNDYRRIKGKSQAAQRAALKTLSTKYSSGGTNTRVLAGLYRRAFENRYAKIINDYRSTVPDYFDKAHYAYKVRAKKNGGTSRASGDPIKFTGWALMSGFLRESIRSGLANGGNKYIDVPNLMLQGGYTVDWTQYLRDKSGRVRYFEFVQHLEALGIIQSPEDFIDFDDRDWDNIYDFMQELIENRLIPDIEKVFQAFRGGS